MITLKECAQLALIFVLSRTGLDGGESASVCQTTNKVSS